MQQSKPTFSTSEALFIGKGQKDGLMQWLRRGHLVLENEPPAGEARRFTVRDALRVALMVELSHFHLAGMHLASVTEALLPWAERVGDTPGMEGWAFIDATMQDAAPVKMVLEQKNPLALGVGLQRTGWRRLHLLELGAFMAEFHERMNDVRTDRGEKTHA